MMPFKLPPCGYVPLLFLIMLAPAGATVPASPSRVHIPNLSSPVGRWKTVDDRTGQVKSIVAIREWQGVLYGRIEKLFDPPAPHPLCIHCRGAFKDKPVLGMQILWGMRKHGDQWSGGYVLDPESGNIYHCILSLKNGGEVLRLHGYIGFPIFGRTERWTRVQAGR